MSEEEALPTSKTSFGSFPTSSANGDPELRPIVQLYGILEPVGFALALVLIGMALRALLPSLALADGATTSTSVGQ